MTDKTSAQHDPLRDLWRNAARSVREEVTHAEPDVSEEDLAVWLTGNAAASEQARLERRLVGDPRLRSEVVALASLDDWEVPEVDANDSSIEAVALEGNPAEAPAAPTAPPATPRRDVGSRSWVGIALSLLLIVGGLALLVRFRADEPAAIARRQLARGDAIGAMVSLERAYAPGTEVDAEAAEIWEQAAYEVARSALARNSFQTTQDVVAGVRQRDIVSPRLTNLAIQAALEVPAEQSLAFAGTPLDFGFGPDGRQRTKALPAVDSEADRLRDEVAERVERDPAATTLALNYVHLLLQRRELSEAKRILDVLDARDTQPAAVAQARGLLAFLRGNVDAAAAAYQRAVEESPENTPAWIGLAVARLRQGDIKAARAALGHARAQAERSDLVEQIAEIEKEIEARGDG